MYIKTEKTVSMSLLNLNRSQPVSTYIIYTSHRRKSGRTVCTQTPQPDSTYLLYIYIPTNQYVPYYADMYQPISTYLLYTHTRTNQSMCTFCICTQTPSVSSVYKHVPTSQYVLTVDKHFMYINTYQPSSIYFVYLLYTNTYSQSVCTFCTHNYQSISMYLLYPHIPINQYVPSVQNTSQPIGTYLLYTSTC